MAAAEMLRAAEGGYREECLRWLSGYLARPHPAVGRDGAVCPFVAPALQAGSVEIRVWDVPADPAEDDFRLVIERAVDEFRHTDFAGRNRTLHTLVVVLPEVRDDRLELLDRAQAALKTPLATEGLMLGQFHPRCPEPAARNPAFLVGRSPVPMIALRHMAFHDVLFLHERPEWFEPYARRFGSRYRVGLAADPTFSALFHRAVRAYGLPLPLDRWRAAAPAVRPVPAAVARPAVDAVQACRILGYELRTTASARDADQLGGILPSTGPAGRRRYDHHDVANLALATRTGRSLPEQAESMALRFGRDHPATWTDPRAWQLRLRWTCSAPDCPGGPWRLPRPEPDAAGTVRSWRLLPPDPRRPGSVTLAGEVVRGGSAGELDGAAAEVYDTVLAGLRTGTPAYQRLPDPLHWNLDAALAAGVTDCVSTSLLVEREAVAAGLRARVRRGLLLGPVTGEHAWAEVERDGRWQPLDPVLGFLDHRVNGRRAGADLAAFCRGSLVNRLLPLPAERGRPLARHDCPDGGVPVLSAVAWSPRTATEDR